MMNRLFCVAVLLSWTMLLAAQGFSGGFKSGLNFSTFRGPVEMNDNGESLENFKTNSGFHIGAVFQYSLTNYFGFRTELLYTQKGVDYTYEGQSFWIFTNNTDPVVSVGNRVTILTINNSYLELPLMTYVRLGRIELSAGINASILLGSNGRGDLTYGGTTASGASIETFTVALDNLYFRDVYRGFNTFENHNFTIGSTTLQVPKNIGAYYEGIDSEESLFRRSDFGLNAGVSFFLNKGLFLGFRANIGLTDVTKIEQDYSKYRLQQPDNTFILRDDVDKNLSFQASIGFSL